MRELVLREVVHHVRLVLAHVDAFMDFVFLPLWMEEDPRIVTRCKIRCVEVFSGFVIEEAEFHLEVAHHAGIRRHAFGVSVDEVAEDEFLVSLSDIDDLKGDADEISHGSRAFDLLLLPVKLVHGRTADFVARFQKELGGECAVDAAGHGDDDFFLFCHKNRYPFCGENSRIESLTIAVGPVKKAARNDPRSPESQGEDIPKPGALLRPVRLSSYRRLSITVFPKTIIPGVSPENLIGVKVRRIVLL